MDAPGVPTPNPRVVIPRRIVPDVVDRHGRRSTSAASGSARRPAPPRQPTYGMIGLFHMLPPALAWLWRLVAPRGHDNPSIVDTGGMSSEGVGSYWPFATGRRVDQANLLLQPDPDHHRTSTTCSSPTSTSAAGRSASCRSGSAASTSPDGVRPASSRAPWSTPASRCWVEPRWASPSRANRSRAGCSTSSSSASSTPRSTTSGRDELQEFAVRELEKFVVDDLDPLGREIIACVNDEGSVDDFDDLIPTT